jgi:hypothetical protein
MPVFRAHKNRNFPFLCHRQQNSRRKERVSSSKNQLVVPFQSFINQTPCDYHTQAMTDASIHYICIDDLLLLYKQSHKQERFGRLIALMVFNVTIERIESFIFKTPEERTLTKTNR